MKHASTSLTALAEPMPLPCPNRYELLTPVRALRKELGLTPNDLAVLTALISFLPRDYAENSNGRKPALAIVFPSNLRLSERANGIDERTLRRCLARLAAARLIDRKSSANGKRFPLRYGGVIRDAFGIDLSPLIANYDSLSDRAAQLAVEQERVASLRAEALALRAALLHCDDEATQIALDRIKNSLRRAALTTETILQIIAELRSLGAAQRRCYGEDMCATGDMSTAEHDQVANCPAAKVPARNGQNVRHIESAQKDINKKDTPNAPSDDPTKQLKPVMQKDPDKMAWEDFSNVAAFFPEAPRNPRGLMEIVLKLGTMLRIREDRLTRAVQTAGAGKLLLVLDYLMARITTIKAPDAYFAKIIGA